MEPFTANDIEITPSPKPPFADRVWATLNAIEKIACLRHLFTV
jgi:hypothetical protein